MTRIGVAFSGGPTASEIVACVQLAESLGYESAWVAEGRARVFTVDLGAGTAQSSSTGAGTEPFDLALTPDGTALFISDRDGGQLLEVDAATGAVVGSTAVGAFPADVVIRD